MCCCLVYEYGFSFAESYKISKFVPPGPKKKLIHIADKSHILTFSHLYKKVARAREDGVGTVKMTAAFALTMHEQRDTSQAFGLDSFIVSGRKLPKYLRADFHGKHITQVFMGLVAYA